MKKRYLYALLFLLPGALWSLVATLFLCGAATGFLWLFVFGDNLWPASSGLGLSLFCMVSFVALFSVSVTAGFLLGKKLEAKPGLNHRHLLAAAGLTLAPLLLLVFQQLSVGNLGQQPDSVICGDYCVGQGYPTSGMPPRNSGDDSCICYDDKGNEVLKIPLQEVKEHRQERH